MVMEVEVEIDESRVLSCLYDKGNDWWAMTDGGEARLSKQGVRPVGQCQDNVFLKSGNTGIGYWEGVV
jgi:hypothetical protein